MYKQSHRPKINMRRGLLVLFWKQDNVGNFGLQHKIGIIA